MRNLTRLFPLLLGLAGLAACGGGGSGGALVTIPFELNATEPQDGSVTADPGASIFLTFSLPADLNTVTHQTVSLQDINGVPVGIRIVSASHNASNVTIEPVNGLEANRQYRLVLDHTIQSADGDPLGTDRRICFITDNPVPTIRPNQILDLGDRLNVPRYLPQVVRLSDGRFALIGGFRNETETTDTIEIWNPTTRSFELQPGRLVTGRAEFTATLLTNGHVLLVGGVNEKDGPPLASTEVWDPVSGGGAPGPDLNEARRWHGASRYNGGDVIVSGGFGASGDALDSVEVLDSQGWQLRADSLPVPTAQHLHFLEGSDTVYVTAGNLLGRAARIGGAQILELQEGDIRFRPEGVRTSDGKVMVVAGDTRSINIFDFSNNLSLLANDLLFDRRGAYSLTKRGEDLYLAAGGFQISAGGRALTSLEIVEYLPGAALGFGDAAVYTVTSVELPVPFAGHAGFNDPSGATVLAGGFNEAGGDHSRRVVMIFNDATAPSAGCR